MSTALTSRGGLCSTSGSAQPAYRAAKRGPRGARPAAHWGRGFRATAEIGAADEAPPPLTKAVMLPSEPAAATGSLSKQQPEAPARASGSATGELEGLAYRVPGTGHTSSIAKVDASRGGLIPYDVLESMDTKFIQQARVRGKPPSWHARED